jgi:hypothetical protein
LAVSGSSTAAGWLPDELAMAGRENLDPAHVARHDAKMDAEAEAEVALLARIDRGLCAMGGEVVEGEWSRAELKEHVRDEHSTFSWRIEPMLAQAGFEIIDVVRSGEGFESKYLLRAV